MGSSPQTAATSTLPAGVTDRPATPADAELILPLVRESDLAVVGTSDASLGEIASMLSFPGVDLDRGGRLVLAADGRAVGWLNSEWDPSGDEVFVDVYSIDPAVSGWLLDHGLDFARAVARRRDEPTMVRTACHARDRAFAEVIEARGLVVERRFWQMRYDLDPSVPYRPPPAPAGLTLEVATDDEPGLRLLHHLHEGAFADHWNHTAHAYDAWLERVRSSPGNDPAQRYVARIDGAPAGLLVADEALAEQNASYVRTLGVLREFRGRGVAKALLGHAFSQAQQRGRSWVALGVDSENPTGATHLYEGMGMRVEKEFVLFGAPLAPH